MLNSVTRKMNAYTFNFNNGSVIIDLDKKGEPITGISGKTLRSRPRNINEFNLGRVILDEYFGAHLYGYNKKDVIEFVNRIISLPVKDEKKIMWFNCDPYDCKWFIEYWKNFLELFEKENNYFTAEYLMRYHRIKNLKNQYHNPEFIDILEKIFDSNIILNPRLTPQPILIKEKSYRHDIIYAFKMEERSEKFVATLPDLEILKMYGLSYCKPNGLCLAAEVYTKILSIYKMQEQIKLFNPTFQLKAGKVNNDYQYLESIINENKAMIEDKEFEKWQTRKNFNYENDKYKIIIPITRKELRYYGDYFENCLNGHEYDCYLKTHSRNVGIIIEKETNIPKVCLDFEEKHLRILQFLRHDNKDVREKNLIAFKNEYQQYLESLL